MSNEPSPVVTSWITFLKMSSAGAPMMSISMPVSASQTSFTDGAPSGKGLVIWPMAPSVRSMDSFVGALPAACSALMPSMARPSDMVLLYWNRSAPSKPVGPPVIPAA